MNKLITESADIYHSKKEYIGSSSLKKAAISMAHFHAAMSLEVQKTAAMDNGTLLHELFLEQDIEKYVARPLKEDGSLIASNTTIYKEFLAKNPNKTPIHPDLFNNMYDALTAFADNKTAMKLLKGATIEHSAYAVDHESGLLIKARPDILGTDYIVDLKTTGKILDHHYERTIFSSQYDFQLAHYAETVFATTGQKIKNYYVIAVEQNYPFASKIYKIHSGDIDTQKVIRRQYLNEIAVCKSEGKFPGYRDNIIDLIKPSFLEQETEISFEGIG